MSKIINKYKYILELDTDLQSIIQKDSIFVSYRSPKNIKDILISSKLKEQKQQQNMEEERGCFKCSKCYLCKCYLQETKTFTSFQTNQEFNITSNITCNSRGIIYLIDCMYAP